MSTEENFWAWGKSRALDSEQGVTWHYGVGSGIDAGRRGRMTPRVRAQ